MTHFTVVVALESPDQLADALAPFDEDISVEPYRKGENGEAKDFWAIRLLREENGLNRDDDTVTWAQVADAYNARFGPDDVLLLDEQGHPYQMSTYNPDSKWDWYQIGGRWSGYFLARPDADRENLIHGEPGVLTEPNTDPARCDGGRKSALDLGGMRMKAAAQARTTYAGWLRAVAGTPEAKPWREFADKVGNVAGYSIDDARQDYRAQPRVKAINGTAYDQVIGCGIEEFQIPEAQFVELARAQAVPGYALLRLDGRWMAPGRMGWWGVSSDNHGDRIGYCEAANAYLDSLPEDTWLICVDCHI